MTVYTNKAAVTKFDAGNIQLKQSISQRENFCELMPQALYAGVIVICLERSANDLHIVQLTKVFRCNLCTTGVLFSFLWHL